MMHLLKKNNNNNEQLNKTKTTAKKLKRARANLHNLTWFLQCISLFFIKRVMN